MSTLTPFPTPAKPPPWFYTKSYRHRHQDPPVTNHTLIIEPGLAERHYWRDPWRYRELFLPLDP